MKDCVLLKRWDPRHEMWEHPRSYLAERLKDPQYWMYIGDNGRCAVAWGQIRVLSTHCVLSWFVAERHRRQRYGTEMANLLKLMAPRPVVAKINVARPYSEHIARRLGLQPQPVMETNERLWR